MICPRCFKQVPDDNNLCPICGINLNKIKRENLIVYIICSFLMIIWLVPLAIVFNYTTGIGKILGIFVFFLFIAWFMMDFQLRGIGERNYKKWFWGVLLLSVYILPAYLYLRPKRLDVNAVENYRKSLKIHPSLFLKIISTLIIILIFFAGFTEAQKKFPTSAIVAIYIVLIVIPIILITYILHKSSSVSEETSESSTGMPIKIYKFLILPTFILILFIFATLFSGIFLKIPKYKKYDANAMNLFRQGNYKDAFNLWEKSEIFSLDDAYCAAQIGWIYYIKGDGKKAMEILNKAAKKSPDAGDVFMYLGRIYQENGKSGSADDMYEKAITAYRKELKRFPDSEEDLAYLGQTYVWHGTNLREAIEHLQKALNIIEKKKSRSGLSFVVLYDEDILLNLSKAYYELGNYKEAKNYIEKAISSTDPSFKLSLADEYYTAGLIYSKLEDIEKSKEMFSKVLENDVYGKYKEK